MAGRVFTQWILSARPRAQQFRCPEPAGPSWHELRGTPREGQHMLGLEEGELAALTELKAVHCGPSWHR